MNDNPNGKFEGKEFLTNSQLAEREAIIGNQAAIIRVVSDLRKYRAACRQVLATRYRDGTIDGATSYSFAETINDIEIAEMEE